MMMKKITMGVVAVVGLFSYVTTLDKYHEVVAVGLIGSAASAGVMYAYYRESNAAKVEKVERLWKHVVDNAALVRSTDFSRLVPVFKKFDVFIDELQGSLQGRYDNWLTPWNWFSSMRLAYKKATLLQLLCKYADVLYYWRSAISDDAIQQLGRTVCVHEYTATLFVSVLNDDMNTIQMINRDIYCPFGDTLYEHLRAVRNIIMQSHAYQVEHPVHQV